MRPKIITLTLDALDRNAICKAQTSTAAADLTLNSTGPYINAAGTIMIFDVPRHIGIYSDGDDSGDTFTITGTDRKGLVLTEAITGPNSTTVVGNKNFATVDTVATNGANAGNVEVGTYNSEETPWVPVEYNITGPYTTAITMDDDATMTSQVQYTLENPFSSAFVEDSARKFYGSPGETACRAVRMRVTGYTDGIATLTIMCQTG